VLDRTAATRPTASDAFTTGGTVAFQGLANATWYLHVSAKNVTGTLTNPTHYMFSVNLKGEILDETRVHAVPHPITGKVATIRYDLLAPAQSIVAEVLDERGRKVAVLSASTSPGRNTMAWDTSGMANGIYFLRMKVRRQDGKENVVHKKLAVVR
jgi:hypothetical protein